MVCVCWVQVVNRSKGHNAKGSECSSCHNSQAVKECSYCTRFVQIKELFEEMIEEVRCKMSTN